MAMSMCGRSEASQNREKLKHEWPAYYTEASNDLEEESFELSSVKY